MNDIQYNKLGAAIIVKNAEDSLARAIRSVKPYCSQIVVVDTGSTDSTPQIATREGAELYFRKWENDFSLARNFSLLCMRTDWIISIDSDEKLDGESLERAASLLDDEKIGGASVTLRNKIAAGESKHTYTRLFRRDARIRYEGKIHEQIRPSIERAGYEIAESDVAIDHYGYAEPTPKKIDRNRAMLDEELRQKPNDDWLKFHLADAEFAAGNLQKAKTLLGEILNSPALSVAQTEKAKLRAAQIALSEERLGDAARLLDFASSDVDREGFRLFILAATAMLERDFAKALALYRNRAVAASKLVDQKIVSEALKSLEKIAG